MIKTVERKPIPMGDAQFEANRQAIIEEVAAKVPPELVLPEHLINNSPLDVTSIPTECGLLTSEEIDITKNYGLIDLAEAIASKKFTSVAVTSAFCKRAIIAHQLTFCLSDFYMLEALEQARKLDDHLERTGRTIGPLHGIPISIKETIPVKGQLWSLGFVVTRTFATKDAPLVDILRKLGAVFYVKTHQPAAVFSLECTSFLGRTLNPHNINLSSGGSSGGEAALLAMRGSPFGFGTDIGGSIRVPASFCGLYGLKGSGGFLPMSPAGPSPAILSIDDIIGPVSHSLRDLDYMLRNILAQNPYLLDPRCLPIPYTGLGTSKRRSALKIGILKSDSLVQPQPPTAEAIDWAQTQLQKHGFQVTNYNFYQPARAHKLLHNLVIHDGMKLAHAAFKAGNEPDYPVFDSLISHAIDLTPDAALNREDTAIAIATKRFERDVYREEFLADWIAQGNPEIVICPMSPASAHDTGNLTHNSSNPHFWNLLDYPGLAVPTPIRAGSRDDYPNARYEDVEPLGAADQETKMLWTEHDYRGAPIGLNIVAKRHMENELLAAVGMIQQALGLP